MLMPYFLQDVVNWLNELVTLNPNEPFKTGAKVVSMVGTGATIATTLATKTYPWLRAKVESRKVSNSMGATLFTAGNIERSIRYYVLPDTQSIDPAGGEESRLIHTVRSTLFKTLDEVLGPNSEDRYHILLADSGMGKTSALINYYVRHLRRWRKPYDIALIPLGIPDADERISAVENKARTVLFLDALDEDTLAMVDHAERVRMLMKASRDFQRVLITCRTQFFTKDEEMPNQTGILKVGARRGDESAEHVFYKIYLTPFTDKQITQYLKRRYPIWRRRRRRRAFELVKKVPHLTARPMLLSRIDDLVDSERDINYSFEIYEEMVEGWIRREKGFINESDELRDFSERLAVDLFVNRGERGAERVTKAEIEALAKEWGVSINAENLSGRGLLNRDAVGNFKFAHRSIMEYLFVRRFTQGDEKCLAVPWTTQMYNFIWEMTKKSVEETYSVPRYFQPLQGRQNIAPAYAKFIYSLLKYRVNAGIFEGRIRVSEFRAFTSLFAPFFSAYSNTSVAATIHAVGGLRTNLSTDLFGLGFYEFLYSVVYREIIFVAQDEEEIVMIPSAPALVDRSSTEVIFRVLSGEVIINRFLLTEFASTSLKRKTYVGRRPVKMSRPVKSSHFGEFLYLPIIIDGVCVGCATFQGLNKKFDAIARQYLSELFLIDRRSP